MKAMACIGMLMAGLTLSGCQWKGNGGGYAPAAGQVVWQPVPASMRLYPSTRFAQEGEQTFLEVRVEMLDGMGDSGKGVGLMFFELLAGGSMQQQTTGTQIYSWNVTLVTLQDQRQAYDPITRTYRFRLKLDDPRAAERDTHLVARFTPVEGRRLETQARMSDGKLVPP